MHRSEVPPALPRSDAREFQRSSRFPPRGGEFSLQHGGDWMGRPFNLLLADGRSDNIEAHRWNFPDVPAVGERASGSSLPRRNPIPSQVAMSLRPSASSTLNPTSNPPFFPRRSAMRFPALALVALATLGSPAAAQRVLPTAPPPVDSSNAADPASVILQRFVSAWRGAEELPVPHPDTMRFGFEVAGLGGGVFTIALMSKGAGILAANPAGDSVPVFVTDVQTLRQIDRNEMSALTAMGRARQSESVPLDVRMPAGFRWTDEMRALYLPFVWHFFSRGVPEIIRFGEGATRTVHGGPASVLYYGAGLRTGFYQVVFGMPLNAKAEDQTNPFATLIVVTRGAFQAKLGGVTRTMREGEAVVIPAGLSHEFWADVDQFGEFIIVMYGPGA